MTLRNLLASALVLASVSSATLHAQDRPIGFWRGHLPYNNAYGVTTDGAKIFAIAEKGVFTYDPSSDSYERFSKVEGLHETGTAAIAYDRLTGTCIIGYANSNIDLYRNGNFKVMPELKNKSFAGSKAINMIYARNGLAYISCGLGVVVIDLEREEVRETYTFTRGGQVIGVNGFTADSNWFYMITTAGMYRCPQNSPAPQILSSWQLLDGSRNYSRITTAGTNAILSATTDSLFRLNGAVPEFVWRPDSGAIITSLDGGAGQAYVGRFTYTGSGRLYHVGLNNQITDSSDVAYPRGAVETLDGRLWIADQYQGLALRNAGNSGVGFRVPPGPNSPQNYGLTVRNKELWVAHGGYNGAFSQNLSNAGMSGFRDEAWRAYQLYNFDLFRDSVRDILSVAVNPVDNTLYAGTFGSGLIELKPDGTGRIHKQGALQRATLPGGTGEYPATSVAVDRSGNVWVTQIHTPFELAVRSSSTGEWTNLQVPQFGRGFRLGFGLIIDDFNQKWYYSGIGGGVIVYNDGETPDNPADDAMIRLTAAPGGGNLPSDVVRCLMKDRDGAIWVGTDDGIGIYNNPGGMLVDGANIAAEKRPVQFDQFAGLLFAGESVRAMAVDGGNRKWIGTTNGVWLLSADATKILERFTVDNSPLPSNGIQSIAVDPVTGDVYIGTDEGLVSYRGSAIEGGATNSTIQTFPNPVPSGYGGTIAIRGLVNDADVRITDIAGQLVYRTKAAGGQAVWNGLDYTGARPATGIYLIFATNRDGSQATTGKFMFMH